MHCKVLGESLGSPGQLPLEKVGSLFSFCCCCCLVAKSCPTLLIPWTVAHQAPLSIGFPRQEYPSGLPFPSPGDLPDPGIKPLSSAFQVDSLPLSHQGSP